MQPSQIPLPLYVSRRQARGRIYYYFRFHETFVRLPDNPHSHEFRKAYAKQLAFVSGEMEVRIIPGSVRALMRDFKSSPEWANLAPKTQVDYARVLDFLAPIGDYQADNVRRQHVIKLRNKMPAKDRTRDLFVSAVSRMFTIGLDLGYTDRNPAARIERLATAESFVPWPQTARATFETSTLPGWLRTAYMIGLYTGQRLNDVLRLSWSRYDGQWFHIRQGRPEAKRGKGRKGRVVELDIPAPRTLRDYLARLPRNGLLMVAHEDGTPVKDHELQHTLRSHLDDLGLTDLSFHGLRHTTGTALAECGATDREIMAITGHLTEQMVGRYTKKANQRVLAAAAVRKLDQNGI